MNTMRNLALVSAMIIAGCSDNSAVVVGNTNPLGIVAGFVLDAATEAPMAGAMVKLVTGPSTFTGTTDMDGVFRIPKVPSGNFILQISATGFQSAIINDSLSGSVGNFPVSDPSRTIGPVGLIKNDGTFSVKLIDQNGIPVSGIKIIARPQVRWVDFSNGVPQAIGNYDVEGTSDMNGVVMLSGLPNYAELGLIGNYGIDQLTIDVPPVMVMGSEIYSYLGGTFTFYATRIGSSSGSPVDQPIIQLAGPNTALRVLESNVDYLRGLSAPTPAAFNAAVGTVLAPTAPINVAFNQAINRSTIRAQLFTEEGTPATVTMTAGGAGNLLTLTPAAALTAGQRFNLLLHVDSAQQTGVSNNKELNVAVPFFVQPAMGTSLKILTTSTKLAADKLSFTFDFSEPIGVGFASQATIACVVFYDGINLDNGDAAAWPGEWNNGMGLSCVNGSTLNPAIDITKMTPVENLAPGMPITGFSKKWQIIFDGAADPTTGCKPGVLKGTMVAPGPCVVPITGTTVHFVFSRAPANQTIKRPDGTPVPDDTRLTVPIPAP